MSTIQDHPSAFGSYMPAVPQDEAKLKQFAETVTGSDSLRFFAVAHGYKRSAEEAEQVYVKARAMLHALSGQAPISDEMLDAVNGRITLAGIGAAIGAAGSLTIAVGCFTASPCTGGTPLVVAAAAIASLSGAAALSVGAGARAVGAGIGAAGGHIIRKS